MENNDDFEFHEFNNNNDFNSMSEIKEDFLKPMVPKEPQIITNPPPTILNIPTK